MTPEDRAAFFGWPDRRNCDWDCPWPSYCVDCHDSTFAAMVDAREGRYQTSASTPLADMPKAR